ncbi:MAG: integrase arm-type DNA-binding domain-containing protein [Pseudomonadota bacterium]|nr:integrase arm-type DNA-binding domain-containing protein [Pseudomonadota bacterium]
MAQQIKRLTDRQIKTLTKPGRHADGGGLYLVVDKSGAKRWAMLVTVNGRRREYGLGSILAVDVQRARELAQQTREAIARGEDPRRQKQDTPTFKKAAETVIAEQAPGWRGRNTKAHWERSLYVYAKDIGGLPVDVIQTDDVLSVVRPLWRDRPESGRKLRQRIETVLDVATVRGWRQGANPARLKGHLDKLLPRQSKIVQHRRAVAYENAPAVMAKLAKETATSARAMEWTILTAAREGMTRFMRWGDIEGDVWSVPASQMKVEEQADFRVPLAPQALAVLDMVKIGEPDPKALVFPGARGKPMSDQTMDALLARMGVDATPHGFRSTFRDWAGDCTDHPREVAEAALAHVLGSDTERAYRRRDAFAKRRRLMTDWADFIRPLRPEGASALPDE